LRKTVRVVLFIVSMFALLAGATLHAAGPSHKIIVHPNNPSSTLDRRFVQDAFLKKVTSWPGGDVIRPVDLAPRSRVREEFSDQVLARPIAAVRRYWQQNIFAGRSLPPPELESDEQVIEYVLKHEGAIGYVSPNASLRGSKVVALR
jgi:ABC-type phosphate transport system substrate-binding protein